MSTRAPDAERVTAAAVTNEISGSISPAQSGVELLRASRVIAFPRFMAGDVDLCHVLAIWHELEGDTRRAEELREIGYRIRWAYDVQRTADGWFPPFTLLDAGRVGMAGIRAARDADSCITTEKVRPLTRRLSVAAIGVALDVTAEG